MNTRTAILITALTAALAAGCGSSAPEPSAGPTPHRYSAYCLSSSLRLTAGPRVSEATQQNTLLLVFRNTSATGCHMQGYPGIALAGRQGTPLPFTYRRHGDQMLTSAPPPLVQLPPGGLAYSAINKNTCVAFTSQAAVSIQVTPPGDRQPLALRLPRYPILGYCGAADPGHTVDIAPVEPTAAGVRAH